jgi:hypothetical protein
MQTLCWMHFGICIYIYSIKWILSVLAMRELEVHEGAQVLEQPEERKRMHMNAKLKTIRHVWLGVAIACACTLHNVVLLPRWLCLPRYHENEVRVITFVPYVRISNSQTAEPPKLDKAACRI